MIYSPRRFWKTCKLNIQLPPCTLTWAQAPEVIVPKSLVWKVDGLAKNEKMWHPSVDFFGFCKASKSKAGHDLQKLNQWYFQWSGWRSATQALKRRTADCSHECRSSPSAGARVRDRLPGRQDGYGWIYSSSNTICDDRWYIDVYYIMLYSVDVWLINPSPPKTWRASK